MSDLFNTQPEEVSTKPRSTKYDSISWDFLSLLYKSARIGDARTAVICAEVLRQISGEYRVILTLNQLVGEDLHPLYYQKIMPIVSAYTDVNGRKINKGHNLWQSVYLLAKSPKWYMDNITAGLSDADVWNGLELEDIRQEVNVTLELHKPENLDNFITSFKFPTFTYDQHTWKGKKLMKTGTADLRLDGGWENRYNVKRLWDNVVKENRDKTYAQLLEIYRHKLYLNA